MSTVSKFNTEIKEHGSEGLNPATDNYLTIENEEYWYGLITGTYLFIKPIEFTGNQDNDVANFMVIYYYKDGYDENIALEYLKHLIKANNNTLTEDEIKNLIEEAKTLSVDDKTANNGKGISVGIVEKEDHYEYQVIRWYK